MISPLFRNALILICGLILLLAHAEQSNASELNQKQSHVVLVGENSYTIAYRESELDVKTIEQSGAATLTIDLETLSNDMDGILELELPNDFVTAALGGLPPLVSKVEGEIDPNTVPGGIGVFASGPDVNTVAESNILSAGCTESALLQIIVPGGSDRIVIENTDPLLGIAPTLSLSTDRCVYQTEEPVSLMMQYNNTYPEGAAIDLVVTSADGKAIYQNTTETGPNTSVSFDLASAKPGLYFARAQVVGSALSAEKHFMIQGNTLLLPIKLEEKQYDILIETDSTVLGLIFSMVDKNLQLFIGESQNDSGTMSITIPSVLLGGNISATSSENIQDLNFEITKSNTTHTTIEVEYAKQGSEPAALIVMGTTAIPEFTAGLIVLIITVSIATIIVLNRIRTSGLGLTQTF